MAAAMVTMAELRSNLGIGTLYTDATVEECCQSAEDLIQGYLWHNDAPVIGSSISNYFKNFKTPAERKAQERKEKAAKGSYSSGGKVSASSRGDGIAQRGKTRGKMR